MSTGESDQTPAAGGQRSGPADLSDRQYACLVHAGEGMSSKEIGRLLGISPSTVDNHIHAAVTKLHAKNRWQAAQLLHPIRTKESRERDAGADVVPPIGGRLNRLPVRQRLTQMVTIAALGLISLTSASVIIMGAIEVLDFN